MPRGAVAIRLEFLCDEPRQIGGPATVELYCNDFLVARGRIDKQIRGRTGFGECLDVGRDSRSPVWPGYRYRLPYAFTGTIRGVRLELGEAAERTTGELIEEHLAFD